MTCGTATTLNRFRTVVAVAILVVIRVPERARVGQNVTVIAVFAARVAITIEICVIIAIWADINAVADAIAVRVARCVVRARVDIIALAIVVAIAGKIIAIAYVAIIDDAVIVAVARPRYGQATVVDVRARLRICLGLSSGVTWTPHIEQQKEARAEREELRPKTH